MLQARRILVVDDDDLLRLSLVEQLGVHHEFCTLEAANVAEALAAVRVQTIDLIIMDVGLPDGDGREAVKKLRNEGFHKPIILLTGHDSEIDIVSGFDSGANDYVNKPFRFAVLLARIRAHSIHKSATADSGPFDCCDHAYACFDQVSLTIPEIIGRRDSSRRRIKTSSPYASHHGAAIPALSPHRPCSRNFRKLFFRLTDPLRESADHTTSLKSRLMGPNPRIQAIPQ